MSFFSTKELAFGLDISDQTLRLIQFSIYSRAKKIQLYNEIKLPPGCVLDGEIKQSDLFIEHLKKLIKTRYGQGAISDQAIIVLPEKETFLKTITLENIEPNRLKDEIKNSILKNIPLEISEIIYDWQIISKNNSDYQILVAASPKKAIENYSSIFNKADITVSVMEPEAASINRILIEHNNDKHPQLIIDIGKNRTGLFIYDGQTIKFTTSLPISGDKIDKIISHSLDLTPVEAEKTKLICGLDEERCQGAILEIMKPTIKELSEKILASLKFYYTNYQDSKKIENIVICGGGANTIGITTAISSEIKIKTELSNPFKKIKNPNKHFFTESKSQSFITAIGLGLRGVKPESFYDKH